MKCPITIYAVLDLDNTETYGQTHNEHIIMSVMTDKLCRKIDKIMKKERKCKGVKVTVVGAANETNARYLSVFLERVLCMMNSIFKQPKVEFKNFVLLDNNGKALRPRTGCLLASDSPPSDVFGRFIFLTSRPYVRALLKKRCSWWGGTVGRLTSVSKLKWTGIR